MISRTFTLLFFTLAVLASDEVPAQTPEDLIGAASLFKDGARKSPTNQESQTERYSRFMGNGHQFASSGLYADAELQYSAAVSSVSPPDWDTSRYCLALSAQARSVYMQGRLEEAVALLEKSLSCQLLLRELQPEHFEFLYRTILTIFRANGDLEKLTRYYQKLLTAEVFALKDDHPDLPQRVDFLVQLLVTQEKYEAAENWQLANCSSVERLEWAGSPRWDKQLAVLFEISEKQTQYANAELTVKRILFKREKQLGPNHPKVAETLEIYSGMLRKLDRKDEADRCSARALSIRVGNGVDSLVTAVRLASSIHQIDRARP